MLFVHILDSKAHRGDEPIIEIPPSIYSRMLSYSNVAIESANSYYGGGYYGIKVVNVDNKHYFAFVTEKYASDTVRYYFCIYLLKDI